MVNYFDKNNIKKLIVISLVINLTLLISKSSNNLFIKILMLKKVVL